MTVGRWSLVAGGAPPPAIICKIAESYRLQKYAYLRRKRGKNKRSRYKIYIYSFAAKNRLKAQI